MSKSVQETFEVEVEDDSHQTMVSRLNQEYLKPNIGLLFLIVSQLFNSLMVVSTKVLELDREGLEPDEPSIQPLQILLVRMIITYIGTLVYMHINKQNIEHVPFGDPKVRPWLVLRGAMGFFGVFGMYFSLLYLTISDAVLITFLAPSVTIILAWLILREHFCRAEAIGSFISLTGVVLIVRPSFLFGDPQGNSDDIAETMDPRKRLIATLVALWGVVGISSVWIIIRYIGKRAHAIINVSYFSLITGLIALFGILFIPSVHFQTPRTLKQWLLFANLGVCGFCHQLLLTIGIQKERAGRGTLMSYTNLIYAVFWDVLLFRHWPSFWSLCGMILITGSTLYVVKMRTSEAETEKPNQEPSDLESVAMEDLSAVRE
ncbi:hypothetical protein RNJ44_03280 [Nakaseomyces bracarensis]|uniref:EamA domain-containing protein n=1 Tax=Nakaseomyces bracarensis TaxID=273131 RepID=A0ABR4NZ93_9SACH